MYKCRYCNRLSPSLNCSCKKNETLWNITKRREEKIRIKELAEKKKKVVKET